MLRLAASFQGGTKKHLGSWIIVNMAEILTLYNLEIWNWNITSEIYKNCLIYLARSINLCWLYYVIYVCWI